MLHRMVSTCCILYLSVDIAYLHVQREPVRFVSTVYYSCMQVGSSTVLHIAILGRTFGSAIQKRTRAFRGGHIALESLDTHLNR